MASIEEGVEVAEGGAMAPEGVEVTAADKNKHRRAEGGGCRRCASSLCSATPHSSQPPPFFFVLNNEGLFQWLEKTRGFSLWFR